MALKRDGGAGLGAGPDDADPGLVGRPGQRARPTSS